MLRDWFDERFRAAGAKSFHFSVLRMAMAAAMWPVLGLGVGWREAGIWAVAAVLIEWPLREVTRPMARGLSLSRVESTICLAFYGLSATVWSAAGALLWASDHVACQVAGAAWFAGQLLYLTTHHGRSKAALVPALPALVAPALGAADPALPWRRPDRCRGHHAGGGGPGGRQPRGQPGRRRQAQDAGRQHGDRRAPRTAAALANGRLTLRILAAEDNAINQLVLRTLLAQVGVEPTVVGDGQAALDAWTREPWDLILMDVQMPVMDGPTAARAIRAAEARTGRAYTPIVALTANAMAHQVSDYAEAGMDGHVAKPIEAASLFAALEIAHAPRRPDAGEDLATAAA